MSICWCQVKVWNEELTSRQTALLLVLKLTMS
jgi:hypothetical protein